MKILCSILLVVVFIAGATAQKKAVQPFPLTQPDWEKVEYKYDKFKDFTNISLMSQILGKPDNGIVMMLFTTFQGKIPKGNEGLIIGFICVSDRLRYDKERSLIILADNSKLSLAELSYDTETIRLGKGMETIIYSLSGKDFQKIATSKSVEMQLKETEFALSAKQLSLIREFYKSLVP